MDMIKRDLFKELQTLLSEYPVVTILGPRQAGKTTLAQQVKGYDYSNLEIPETRELAITDPNAYLAQFRSNVIIDEIQRVPQLLSYIQNIVDQEKTNGRFILTGSHQLQLQEAVSQSLAGRTAILKLLPFSIAELKSAHILFNQFEEYCYHGFLPRIYDQSMRPSTAYSNYYQTYVERDVRQLISLKNHTLFEKFLKVMAGRVGQVINYQSLSNDVGVDNKTVKEWLSILEASFILFKLPPYFENFSKRTLKSPKYYFTEIGLLTFLLGIEKKEHITRDPLMGSIFENLVVIECLKSRYSQGKLPNLYYFRDTNGVEVDVLFQDGPDLVAIEIKASSTFSHSHLGNLKKFQSISPKVKHSYLVYSGPDLPLSGQIDTLNYLNTDRIFRGLGLL